MTTRTIKLIAFIVLLVHGIGHFQGVAAGFGLKINNAAPAQSWLLKGLNAKTNQTICLILFMLTGVFGVLTALSFKDILFAQAVWQKLAIVTAFLSTLCLLVFPNGFAMFFNKAGAIAVNLFIFYSILFSQNYPQVLFED